MSTKRYWTAWNRSLVLVFMMFTLAIPSQGQDPVDSDYEKIFGIERSSLSHKQYQIKTNNVFTIRLKAKPNLDITTYCDEIHDSEDVLYTDVNEVRPGYYEIIVVPQEQGSFEIEIMARSAEISKQYNVGKQTILYYEVASTFALHYLEYLAQRPFKPTKEFKALGLKNVHFPYKSAIKVNGNQFDFEMVSPDPRYGFLAVVKLGGYLMNVQGTRAANRISRNTLICFKPRWYIIEILVYSTDSEKTLIGCGDVYVHFSEGTTKERWFSQLEKPNSHVYDQEELEYDYTNIDNAIKNIPDAANRNVKTITDYIRKHAKNDIEKVRGVYMWIRENIKYDIQSDGVPSTKKPQSTDFIVERERKTIGGGFSLIQKGMLDILGVECLHIAGSAITKPPGCGRLLISHDWNVVNVNGKWRLLDPTLGMYLADPKDFIQTHFPNEALNNRLIPESFKKYLQFIETPWEFGEWKSKYFYRR